MPSRFCSVARCKTPATVKVDGRWCCLGHIPTLEAKRRERMDSGPTGSSDFKCKTYRTQRWRNFRASWLQEHPTCAACERSGRLAAANVVDHISPHRGDVDAFWAAVERREVQSLCEPCHAAKGARTSRWRGSRRG